MVTCQNRKGTKLPTAFRSRRALHYLLGTAHWPQNLEVPLENRFTIPFSLVALGLFSATVFIALQSSAHASEFVCAARVDCGKPSLPSTQDLPSVSSPTVSASDINAARAKCAVNHSSAYSRLAKSVGDISTESLFRAARGCQVVSEAYRH